MDRENSGTLSKNGYKREGSKQPDAQGSATLTCPHCQQSESWIIAGWLRQGGSGRFTSMLFKTKATAEREKADYLAKKHGDTVNDYHKRTGDAQGASYDLPGTPPETTPAIDAMTDDLIPF